MWNKSNANCVTFLRLTITLMSATVWPYIKEDAVLKYRTPFLKAPEPMYSIVPLHVHVELYEISNCTVDRV